MRQGDKVWCSHSGNYSLRLEREYVGSVPYDEFETGKAHVVVTDSGLLEVYSHVRPAMATIDDFIDRTRFTVKDGWIHQENGEKVSVKDAAEQGTLLSYLDEVWVVDGKVDDSGVLEDPAVLVSNYLKLLEAGDVS